MSLVFEGIPQDLIIDTSNPTTLENEFLLRNDRNLEIIKKYPNAGKAKVYIRAYHPTNPSCSELLLKKSTDLKKMLTNEMGNVDKTKNASIKRAIWDYYSDDLQLQEIDIEISKIDTKNLWEQLKHYMPLYTLFQSDRKNNDDDNEVQNHMKMAVNQILKNVELKAKLDEVAKKVVEKLNDVSKNTLEKLNEMNPEVANSIKPVIPSSDSLKWADVFKSVSITGDDDIPINKRGSGVKRLVLLNFFRAEAERRYEEMNVPNVIYAIEEPETSQHPEYQRKLIEAFIELSKSPNAQIILTTHSPAIVKLLQFEHIKLIIHDPSRRIINIERSDLLYPSLNKVNYLGFGESNEEYHNELYGYIESEQMLNELKAGKDTLLYKRKFRGDIKSEKKFLVSI